MNQNYLSNKPILNLTEETDYIGILDKAKLISSFLKGSTSRIDEFKMYSLYGDWGSGKSTLMRYLEEDLNSEFNTFFFEAWEFENDKNLSFSLLEFLIYNEEKQLEFYNELIEPGKKIFKKGLMKSIKLKTPKFSGIEIEIDPNEIVNEFEKKDDESFLTSIKNFKNKFIEFENKITKSTKKFNIVFIDDLDRCEPEQVLNLISAIKLFFTLGQKTIFFCGIDKEAVEAAVKTKYNDVIKANEYLEKVFDISFSMPNLYNFQKLINNYFDETKYKLEPKDWAINDWIVLFLEELEFTNPRRIKKVLNKYEMLRSFIQVDNSKKILFPNIDLKTGEEKNLFETLLVLYLIILHEFYPNDFNDFLNFEKKKEKYTSNDNPTKEAFRDIVSKNSKNLDFKSIYFASRESNEIFKFNICISPLNVRSIHSTAITNKDNLRLITIKDKSIDYLFFKFIQQYDIKNNIGKNSSFATFESVKKLIKDFL